MIRDRERWPATGLVPVVGIVTLGVLAPSEAHAYVDPGSGSLLLQVVIGSLAAVGAGLTAFWGRIRARFTRRRSERETPPDRRPT